MTFELAVQVGILVSVLVAIVEVVRGIRMYKRQTNVQIFLEYTRRYEQVMQSFPPSSRVARLDLEGSPPEPSAELSLAVLRYLNLCGEEFYLRDRGYLAEDVWQIWEAELKRTLGSPLLRREWQELKREFESYPKFRGFVEQSQQQVE